MMALSQSQDQHCSTIMDTTGRYRKDSGCFFDEDPPVRHGGASEQFWAGIVADWAQKAHAVVEQEAARMLAVTQQRRKELRMSSKEGGNTAAVEARYSKQ